MRSAFLLVALLSACASPSTGDKGVGVAHGPDLGGFLNVGDMAASQDIGVVGADLASFPQDFAVTPPSDLAMSLADFASQPADMTTPPSACGSVTYAGSCSGNTLTYCYNNAVQMVSCASPTMCTTVSGDSDCRYVNGTACGSVDYDGLCDGDTLVYCDNNKLVVQDCTSSGASCYQDSLAYCD